MRKLLLFIALAVLTALSASATVEVQSQASGRLTLFEGLVTDAGNNGIDDVEVTIYCQHEYNGVLENRTVETATTDVEGHFFAFILNLDPEEQCNAGDIAFITTDLSGDMYQSEAAQVVTQNFMGRDYGYASMTIGVPEFTTVTMAVAVVGVTLGIVALRRKE